MTPILILRDGEVEGLISSSVYETIINICNQHKQEQRALAFAFIIHNYSSPQLNKVLADKDYWEALDGISGHLLTVFYLSSQTENFGEDLLKMSSEKRSMYGIHSEESKTMIVPMIRSYLQYEQPIKLPTIFFFQTNGRYIEDFFFIELSEEKIEDSFIELKAYITGVVDEFKLVKSEHYGNSQEIFNLLKNGVSAVSFKRKVAKMTGNFPFQQFIGWLVSIAS